MKIIVFSDSHGHFAPMADAVADETPDMVIFLGDGMNDADALEHAYPSLKVEKVKGNCDFFSYGRTILCEVFDGVKIYAVHGHIHCVKDGMSCLVSSAKAEKAALVLFGHTHIADLRDEDGITVMNPGSIGYGHTYGVINTSDGSFTCELKTIRFGRHKDGMPGL